LKQREGILASVVLLCAFVSLTPAASAIRGAAVRVGDTASQGSRVVGNYREASTNDPDVLSAARFAVRAEGRRRGVRLTLLSVERAETQVVAGTNYRLRLRVRNAAGRVQNVDAEVYENQRRRQSLTRWEAARDVQPSTSAREVKIFLVALEDNGRTGRRIGCGDSLVPVTRTVNATGGATLRAALDELLSVPHDFDSRLKNYWRGNNLRVRSVTLSNGLATIRITGEGPFIAGVCDAPRITEQIRATARQFPTVRRVAVFVNGRTLESALR
jgi:hypothetical protein